MTHSTRDIKPTTIYWHNRGQTVRVYVIVEWLTDAGLEAEELENLIGLML